jgi:hypothetical protein
MLFLQIFIFSSESLIPILVVEEGAVEGTSLSQNFVNYSMQMVP